MEKMYRKKWGLLLVLGMVGWADAAVLVTGVTTNGISNAYGDEVSASDLVNAGQSTFSSVAFSTTPYKSNISAVNDGVVGADTLTDIVFWNNAVSGATYSVTYTLDTSVNTLGYDITSIQTINGWEDNSGDQKNQNYEVFVSTVDSAAFTSLAAVAYLPYTTNTTTASTKVNITEDETGLLASGIDQIRFTYTVALGGQNPSPTIREIDVFGAAVVDLDQATKPVAEISASTRSGTVPLTVVFDASGSSAAFGIVSYDWDFDDGNRASGVLVTHTYTNAGSYTAELTVTDSSNQTATASVEMTGLATITLSSLSDRQIVQRDWNDQASLLLSGTCSGTGTEIQARAVALDGKGTDTGWISIDAAPSGERYAGTLDVDAGWYQVELRLLAGTEVLATLTVAHIGVGDIFIICGQSNSANFGDGRPSAADDRVSYLGLLTGTWVHADDPPGNPSDYPGRWGSPWPKLGDLLSEQDDVPIGFVSIGDGSSSVEEWTPTAADNNYSNLQTAVQSFSTNGFKAVLWHQGENDAQHSTSTEDYVTRLETIIAASRADAGWDVPWGVAQVSYPYTNSVIPSAQLQVVAKDDHVFAGADTDTLGASYRSNDGPHFTAEGLTAHAELWLTALNAAFPDVEITGLSIAGGGASLSFAGPQGDHYRVETIDDLTSGNSWQTVTDIVSLAVSPFAVEVSTPNDSSFYRIKRMR
jgi:PKD repeat protein